MAGNFVIHKSTDGTFHFNLLAANGEVIASSEQYTTREAALAGIESVKSHAADATVEDVS